MTAAADDVWCRDCREGHDHCHGTLLVTPEGEAECSSGPECAAEPERHELDLIPDESA